MTTRTPKQANAAIRHQSKYGPRTAINLCKRSARLAYDVDSDGTPTAAQAWHKTKHRLPRWYKGAPWHWGAFDWWTGGSDGAGHVTIRAWRKGYVWSKDILRPGMWDRVPLAYISATWPKLTYVGASKDIDGVKVIK